LCVEGAAAEQILIGLSEEGICASGGSACHSGALELSNVLRAMGIDMRLGAGAIRLSLSRYTTAEEIDLVVQVLPRVVEKLQCRSEVSS
jgi:cysteine desulfurase